MRYSPTHIAERIRYYGFGRVISYFAKRFGISQDLAFALTRSTKRMVHPMDWLRRKNKRFISNSSWASALPGRIAWRIFAPGDVPGSIEVAKACRSFAKSVETTARSFDCTYVDLLCVGGPQPSATRQLVYDLDAVPEVLDFALSDPIIHAATGYLGEIPILGCITLYASLPNITIVGSQLFHRDQVDRKMFKALVAINDIDTETGPFTLIPADKTALVQRRTGYRRGRINDDRIFAVLDTADKVTFTGPAGSVLFCDSSRCLHHGSRGNRKMRLLLEIMYCSKFCQAEPGVPVSKQRFDRDRFRDPIALAVLGPQQPPN